MLTVGWLVVVKCDSFMDCCLLFGVCRLVFVARYVLIVVWCCLFGQCVWSCITYCVLVVSECLAFGVVSLLFAASRL